VTGLLYRLGRLCVRYRFPVLALWLVAVVAVAVIARGVGEQTSDDLVLPGTDSQRASDTLSARFPAQANGTNPLALQAPAGHQLGESQYKQAIDGVVATYQKDPRVVQISGPVASTAQKSIGYLSLTLRDSPSELSKDEAQSIIDEAAPLKAAGLRVAAGGYLGQKVSKPSSHVSEVVGIVAAILILLFTFGTVVAMGMPIVTALLGLVAGMSVITLLGQVVQVPTTAPALATMIGLGVGIDYGLFVVTRHREQLRGGMEVDESIARTTATAGGAVLFAGSTVIIALLSLALAGIPIVTTLGYTSAIVVAIAVAAALTLLPAMLAILGPRINALRLPGFQVHHDERPHGWQRWARFVADHPWPALATGVLVLLVLAIPLRNLHLGQTNVGALPTDTQARQAYDRMSAGFGAGASGPMLVAVQLSKPATGASDPRLQTLHADLQSAPGVASVSQPLVNKSGSAAVFTLVSANAPSSRATEDTVNDLRNDVIPKATKGQGMSADVGGTTAGYIDLARQIGRKLPLVIGIVLVLSFCLLTLAFRSLLVPLKAVVMNLLSIAAAFGIVTYAFGHHWSATLVGLDGTVPIVSFVPLMMFAILFGLSMDYEVFLMTHVRERWLATGDPHRAVIDGLAGTARVITSAALIMVSVFCAFVINGDPNIKQFGLGMAAAVAVDATVVRCLLVPAIMSLLGPAAWWMPAWLERHLPKLSIEGEDYFAKRDAAAAAEAPKVTV
jgi:RND superfamily putative drug exporter